VDRTAPSLHPCAPQLVRLTLVVVLLTTIFNPSPTAQSHLIAFTNVTLIDGSGVAPRTGITIVIEGDRIVTIGGTGAVQVPAAAVVVDGRGKFLIPGLSDMHVHLGTYDEGVKVLPRLVGYGITRVRDMASPTEDILRLRRETASDALLGPQIVTAGPILQRPLPFAVPPLVRTVTAADARQVVDELHAKGVDFIKVGDTLTRDAYLAIAEESKRLGLPFAGHLPVFVSAAEATQAGQRSIEHFGSAGFRGVLLACSSDEARLTALVRDALTEALAGGPPPEERLYQASFLKTLVDRYDSRKAAALFESFVRNGTWHEPTLRALRRVWDERRTKVSTADAAAGERVWAKTLEMFADMRKRGVKILAGSDLPIAQGVLPLHDELVELVRAGMTPLEALQAATRNPAEFLGRLEAEGTIEVGKRANLVLLDADPLADISNTRRVAAVVVAGRLISGPELERIR
jgi:imidazolonepropionase-like amidohydrolase